jgi:hypothetical protein
MKQLPIGTQSFENLRQGDCLYVDKTEFIYKIATTGRIYLLSRPRRFGKSLTISTLETLSNGQKELFDGLWIENTISHCSCRGCSQWASRLTAK